jgi:hypothetical protein
MTKIRRWSAYIPDSIYKNKFIDHPVTAEAIPITNVTAIPITGSRLYLFGNARKGQIPKNWTIKVIYQIAPSEMENRLVRSSIMLYSPF